MSQPFVEVIDIHRSFDSIHAVRGVSFTLERGQTVGFVGANGAGKTTTMRILALLDAPQRGRVLFNGENALDRGAKCRTILGWMPDAYGAYQNMTVLEYIDFYARAYGYKGLERRQRIDEVMEFTELAELSERYIDTLSKGMSQRLCLGRTLISDPELLILDEPAAGLDPRARLHFMHLVRLMAEQGKTLLISSHILSELEDMCDTLLFIDKGKIVHHGQADSLKQESNGVRILEIQTTGDTDKLQQWLLEQPALTVTQTVKNGFRVNLSCESNEELSELLARAVREGIPVCSFFEVRRKLEDAFVEMVTRETDV